MYIGLLQNALTDVSYYFYLSDLSFEYLYINEAELLVLAQESIDCTTTRRLR